MNSRRSFLVTMVASLALAPLARPTAAGPQGGRRTPRIGYLATTTPVSELEKGSSSRFPGVVAFVEGLRILGWHDGRNVGIVWRSAEDQYDRLPRLAAELTRIPVDVIVSFGFGVEAAARATKAIPIVGLHPEPVERGYAESLARPGRNVTGLTSASAGLAYQKQLALLKEASPRMSRVALVAQSQGEQADRMSGILEQPRFVQASKALGLDLIVVSFGEPSGLPAAIRSAARQGAQALLFDEIAILAWREIQKVINEEAIRHRLLVMHSMLGPVEGGGLMAYGTDPVEIFRRLPHFVDRILRGSKAGDIPIEQPRRPELHVNVRAAKDIGLELPPALLLQADRVFH